MIQNNYLVILAGSPRGGEKAWKSMYKHVLEPLSADLAIVTGKKYLNNQSFIKKAKFHWVFDEPESWRDYFQDQEIFELFDIGKNTGLLESGIIQIAIKDYLKKNYLSIVKSYDFIIFARFDQYYIKRHNFAIGNNIIIPEGEDYFGICDRHITLPSKYIENYLSILEYFIVNHKSLSKVKYLNCETLNKKHLESFLNLEQIHRSKRFQFTVAKKTDLTNWRVAKIKILFFRDIKLKYPDEFIISIKNYINSISFKNYKTITFSIIILLINYYYLLTRTALGKLKN